jgi:hypothetical protein
LEYHSCAILKVARLLPGPHNQAEKSRKKDRFLASETLRNDAPQRRNSQGIRESGPVAEPQSSRAGRIRSTTVICVRRNGSVVMAADGQVTLGDHVLKHSAKKIRRLYQDKILAGFAGSTADAFSLFKRFEVKLEMAIYLPGTAEDQDSRSTR